MTVNRSIMLHIGKLRMQHEACLKRCKSLKHGLSEGKKTSTIKSLNIQVSRASVLPCLRREMCLK
jgi:hypothetical protein